MPRVSHRQGNGRNGSLLPPQQSPFKSPLKLPLNDDRYEKAVRFQSRHALHERQINSIKAAASPVKMRKSLGAAGSPRTPSGEGQENDGSQGIPIVSGNAVTPMKRVPILANFEEWMKMATDNKINATNSWNFALIDYFHDMSLLREGDSVNFQKASCTLDGCVKIYTSRVDSVATETGKLLSGLADSSSKKQNEGRSGVNDEGEEEEEEEEGEDGVRRRAKRKVQRSSEATLAPSFQQLQLKKMELEFSVDPLFKKASADFDEGGAKGLLLNHLTMDGNGRIAFDSSDDNREEEREQSSEGDDTTGARDDTRTSANCPPETGDTLKDDQPVIELATLQQRFFPDLSKLNEQDICPSLKSFELDGIAESLNTPFLKAPEDWRKDQSPSKNDNGEESQDAGDGIPTPEDDNDDGDLGGFDIGMDVGFGEGGEAWAKEAAMNSQSKPFDAALSGANGIGDETEQQVVGYSADSAQYGVTLSQDHDRENILSYFDQALHKNWAGPEHWRIRKIKDFSKPAAPPRQRKEKEPYEIDFAAPLTQSMADVVYNPAANNSAISLPKSQWKSKTRNLLPDDKHFNSRQLLRLFLKPKARIGGRRPTSGGRRGSGVENVVEGELDEAFWARRHQDAAASLAAGEEAQAHGDYDANFFQDDGLGALPGIDDDGDEFADARETFSPDLGMEAQPAADSIDNGLAPGSQDGFGNQLVTQSRRLRPEYVQYARVAKKVDVRRLKEEMWRGMGLDDHPSIPATPSAAAPSPAPVPKAPDGTLKFTSVMNSLQSVYPQQAMADISTSYCFICLLHLANEKGLVLGNEQDFEDLSIAKDHTAEIEEAA